MRNNANPKSDWDGAAVSLRGVSKSYDNKRNAVTQVSLEVMRGEFVVLLGPSGSGKSTIVRAIAGIERISGGTISIFGTTVAADGRHVNPEDRGISMVFGDYALWPHMSVLDNVAFALKRNKADAKTRRLQAGETLAKVGLGSKADRFPAELSGGEQQRVALARALVAHSGLILFDEPLSNLDSDLRENLRIEIATLTRECNATVIYITHDQSEAFALADKIGVLKDGRLVQYGVPEDIYESPADSFIAHFTGIAGEVRGIACGITPEGLLQVDVPGLRRSVLARPVEPISRGQRVRIAIRPAAVSMEATLVATTDIARVADVAYRGRGYEHAVTIGEHVLSSVFSAKRVPRGSGVELSLDPRGCLAFCDHDNSELRLAETRIDSAAADFEPGYQEAVI